MKLSLSHVLLVAALLVAAVSATEYGNSNVKTLTDASFKSVVGHQKPVFVKFYLKYVFCLLLKILFLYFYIVFQYSFFIVSCFVFLLLC